MSDIETKNAIEATRMTFLRNRNEVLSHADSPLERMQYLMSYADTLEQWLAEATWKLSLYNIYDVGKIYIVAKENDVDGKGLRLDGSLRGTTIDKDTVIKIAEDNRKTDVIRTENEDGVSLYCYITHGVFRITISKQTKEVAWLSDVTVDEGRRRIGIGNRILSEAEDVAKKNGCSVISLQVLHGSWMKDWYARKGYSVVGDGYMDNMVMMSKKLK